MNRYNISVLISLMCWLIVSTVGIQAQRSVTYRPDTKTVIQQDLIFPDMSANELQFNYLTGPLVEAVTLQVDQIEEIPLVDIPSITLTNVGVYSALWDDSAEVPSKGAIYAKLESISSGGSLGYDINVTSSSTNDTPFILTSLDINQDTTFSLSVTVLASGPTNSAAFVVKTAGRKTGTNDPVLFRDTFNEQVDTSDTNYTHADLYTNTWYDLSGDTLRLMAKGLASENLNWLAQGFSHIRINALPAPEAPDPETVDLTNGLVAYWRLDEVSGTRNDVSDNGFNLTQSSTTVGSDTGIIESAVEFPGNANYYLEKENDAAFSPDSFSLAGWVYLSSTNSSQYIFNKSAAADNLREWMVAYSSTSGRIYCTMYTNLTTGTIVGSYDLLPEINSWYFIAFVVDASELEIRSKIGNTNTLDAWVRQSMTDWTTIDRNTTAPVRFGRLGGTATIGPFNGRADEWGFWNRALNDDEVSTLWNSGAGLTHPFTVE